MSGLAVNASISEEPALLCFGNAWEESPMELDSWRLVSSIPRDWSNSGFPAAFLFERTQIVFWTFFHSWRNEEPYHLPPPAGSHAVWFVLPKKKKKGGEEEGRFYALCGAPMFIKHAGVQGRGAPERRTAARSAQAPRSGAERPSDRAAARGAPKRPRSGAERRAVRYCSGAERRRAAQALSA